MYSLHCLESNDLASNAANGSRQFSIPSRYLAALTFPLSVSPSQSIFVVVRTLRHVPGQ